MKKKRIGNDIMFSWTIVDGSGQPYDLEGKDLTLTLSSALGCDSVISPYYVSGNVISWVFYGKDQKTLGKYIAKLVENNGAVGMKTVDIVDAVYLVPHTYQEGGEDRCSHLSTETIDLNSCMDTAPAGLPAGFGEVTAELVFNGGDPYVEVESDGPDTAKNFHFTFYNLGADIDYATTEEILALFGIIPSGDNQIVGHTIILGERNSIEDDAIVIGDASEFQNNTLILS